jgi:tRNA (guanine6-N2)-methyltransferase
MVIRYEVEVADGLADIAAEELKDIIGNQGTIYKQHRSNEIPFSYSGNPQNLLSLQTVLAVYQVLRFPVPRPKALLGHQNFQHLIEQIQAVMRLHENYYQSLYISAAGSESSVMARIKTELTHTLGLSVAQDEGDLLLRIRPTPKAKNSWDVLVRLTPRPLATREWRICNMEGALNASVANSMVRLTNPTLQDTFLNIACGSGTIMIERLEHLGAKQVLGCDVNPTALSCAASNIKASGYQFIQLLQSDGMSLPLADNSVDALCADLPFGQLVGSHEENEWLYPALLTEAARTACPQARFVVLTHEVRLMENVLAMLDCWQVKQVRMITLSGLHPRIFTLECHKS